jgi:hypothetical protein
LLFPSAVNKTQRSIGVLLLASSWLVACGGKTNPGATGVGGTQGGGGAGLAGAGGHAGQPSDASVSDGPIYPNDAGKCPMQGAYPRDGGICVCQADVPTVCDGVCVATQTDNDHCGDCATKCGSTSACSNGKCSTPPTVVLAAPTPAAGADGGAASCGPLRLAVAGTTLYWTDTLKGTVNSIPVAGGSPTVIASAQAAPTQLQVAGGNVFWLVSGEKKIMKAAVGAGTPTLVAAAPATDAQVGGFAVTADGLTVYFSSSKADATTHPRGTISKVAAAGGAITVLAAQDHGVPAAVAVDGTTVAFPVDGNGDVNAISFASATLAQCGLPPADGGSEEVDIDCSRLGRSQGELFTDAVFAFGGAAYWLDGASLKTGLITNNTSGTYDVITAALNGSPFTAFTMDGTTTSYLAEGGGRNCTTWKDPSNTTCLAYGPAEPASIQKASLVKDATAVPLARFVDANDATVPAGATSLAVDGSSVYFATTNCAILRAAK